VTEPGKLAGHAFISYVREDSHRVDQLQRTLEAAGIRVWRDTADLWPGENWRANIRRAITDNALVFIACFSQLSLRRKRSYQNEELLLAIEQLRLRRPDDPWLIPVRFDDCDIPDRDLGSGRTLASIQRADLFGDKSAENAMRLLAAIQRILPPNSAAAAVGRRQQPADRLDTLIPKAIPRLDRRNPVHEFALAMRALRWQAGDPPLAEIARQMSLSRSAVSAYLNGHRLPSPRHLEAFVRACNGEPADWQRRLEIVRTQLDSLPGQDLHGDIAAEQRADEITSQPDEAAVSLSPAVTSWKSHSGQIVTFYSYKGGTGRTMALANVAWILAANGYRVLTADWDLESPGLHRFFHPFLRESDVQNAFGIIDLFREYHRAAVRVSEQERLATLISERARVQQHALSLSWDHFPDGGGLDFLSPGRRYMDYAATLGTLDWDNFYHKLNGGPFVDALRADMKRHYDYVLIDSRTGDSDVGDICAVQLPDILVDCFTLSTQGIEGAVHVARMIEERHADLDIKVLPVPMRVDQAEAEKSEADRAVAARLFAGVPANMSEAQRRRYWATVEVPYRAFYAHEETLAVFGDPPGRPASLLSSYERLTAEITGGAVISLPPMSEQIRRNTKLLFTRIPPLESSD
jgi:transcriptional regulator with XRE-family HTH domain